MNDQARNWRLFGLGIGLLSAALILWVWSAVLLVKPYRVEVPSSGDTKTCEAPLFAGHDEVEVWKKGTALIEACEEARRWPRIVVIVGASVPVSVIGAILFTAGGLGLRLRGLTDDVRELETEARRRRRAAA
ncbi:hypothetical protein [Streptomyces palmae]|uniref:Uncharacterized protein n=1 Tax=Streptomyces palmae TaxID=1701085 RepID=A0A4Z0HAY0_9ACTN|nr:hypothetical protein [Streptomyces palmae]TGB15786.1 hypothetical protein E4099_06155 [Streptomyces palmae]